MNELAKIGDVMELVDRPLVILLSILDSDGQPVSLKDLTLRFEGLLNQVSRGRLRIEALSWLGVIEGALGHLRWKGYAALVGEESHKFQITPLGRMFFKRHKTELEQHLGVKL